MVYILSGFLYCFNVFIKVDFGFFWVVFKSNICGSDCFDSFYVVVFYVWDLYEFVDRVVGEAEVVFYSDFCGY